MASTVAIPITNHRLLRLASLSQAKGARPPLAPREFVCWCLSAFQQSKIVGQGVNTDELHALVGCVVRPVKY